MNKLKNVKVVSIIGLIIFILLLVIVFFSSTEEKKYNPVLNIKIKGVPTLEEIAKKEGKDLEDLMPERKYVPSLEEIAENKNLE